MIAAAPVVEILTIGREILDGRVIDTNSVWLAQKLGELGLIPRHAQRVDDDISRVVEAFQIATARSDLILVTGGLGPTADDLTAEAFGAFLKEKLELNVEALSQIEAVFEKLGRKMIEQQKKQALFPPSCAVLENTEGTAPGFSRRDDSGRRWYFMPGVPKEMKAMFTRSVLPELPRVHGYRSSSWATQFTSEGDLQSRLSPVHRQLLPGFEITYRTRFPENHVGLHGICASPTRSQAYEKLAAEIESILGSAVFSGGLGRDVQSLESVVLDLLKSQRRTLGTVESCTGGLVANRITDIPGSSSAFLGSWVTYDNRPKEALGVDPELIERHGAVSKEVAQALAEAGLAQMQEMGALAPLCIATTGIAGPTGGTPEKPVGLCWIALAESGRPTRTQEIRGRIALIRTEYKHLFSQKALELVRVRLLET